MFELYLVYRQWKSNCKIWIKSKLKRNKLYYVEIYDDIIDNFIYNVNSSYKFYMISPMFEYEDLRSYIQKKTGIYNISNEELYVLFDILIAHIKFKILFLPKVHMIEREEAGVRWFEVHYRNYKQKLK